MPVLLACLMLTVTIGFPWEWHHRGLRTTMWVQLGPQEEQVLPTTKFSAHDHFSVDMNQLYSGQHVDFFLSIFNGFNFKNNIT